MSNNPPAFPEHIDNSVWRITEGMELRDWFAGQAISGNIVNGPSTESDLKEIAVMAYRLAEAMLIEREKYKEE